MRTSGLARAGLALLTLASTAAAVEYEVTQKDFQKCSGMYSRKAWGGNVDPFILTKFRQPSPPPPLRTPADGDDPVVSAVDAAACTDEQRGEFVLAANATDRSRNAILTQAVHLHNPPAIRYPVKKTGYYCVVTNPYSAHPDTDQYTAITEFRNAFGDLPAAQIAKLPFYAAFTIIYAFLALAWAALYYLHRRDILAVQNYVTAILVFLVVEMFMTWLFYDYQNRHGLSAGAKALMILVSILSAVRNSFSFFLLLIVCMGYGVVKPTLGKTMIYVRALAVTHFVFGVIYAIASLSITPENAGPLILLVVLPLAASLTAFYVWTLNSLNLTMKDLMERKQTVKAAMYRRLWWCILLTIIVIFVFFFINSWTFAGTTTADFIPTHWQTRWFILDGWLNLVYLADVAFIAYLWRPTANNRRFAMSDEIAQDDDGFEIESLRDSFDLDLEDPESDGGGGMKYESVRAGREGSPPAGASP
ncbi:Membrane protein PTM1 [Teratosphaeria destructans]|uniref:Membrane protein PTM1 n=1 Tax=Teratosphaeria destructans TaxID=418781 RepID=A0A9W7W389_9PEZI|nr:Membrane protein PTM1 [Teratosphaeria destructans]